MSAEGLTTLMKQFIVYVWKKYAVCDQRFYYFAVFMVIMLDFAKWLLEVQKKNFSWDLISLLWSSRNQKQISLKVRVENLFVKKINLKIILNVKNEVPGFLETKVSSTWLCFIEFKRWSWINSDLKQNFLHFDWWN